MSKPRFKLSKINFIFLTLVLIGYTVLYFLFNGIEGEKLGYYAGTVFMIVAMPLACSVLIWRTSKNDTQSVSLIFNIILISSVFVVLKGFGRNLSYQNNASYFPATEGVQYSTNNNKHYG